VSADGAIAYQNAPVGALSQLTWFDRSGTRQETIGDAATPDQCSRVSDIVSNAPQHRRVERTGGTVGFSWIDAASRLRGDAVVTVMQPADFWNGDNATG
jgi:hypothetical protein